MFEAEINSKIESTSLLSEEVLKKFREYKPDLSHRTLLLWEEHCTECNFPSCYKTCELYDPRIDLKCRLFIDGSIPLYIEGGVNPYILKIKFKKWGKIWTRYSTPNRISLFETGYSFKVENLNIFAGRILNKIKFDFLKIFLIKKFSSLKHKYQNIKRQINCYLAILSLNASILKIL